MNDEEIKAMLLSRDENAIVAAKEKYGSLCLRIAERIIGSADDAEEILNESLLFLWNAASEEPIENLRAYMIKVVRNRALKRLTYNLAEKRSTYSKVAFDELEYALPDGKARDALDSVDTGLLIGDFLSKISEEARAVFVRRYFFFDSVADISQDFKISPSKVKSLLFRTRNSLKKFLSEKGV